MKSPCLEGARLQSRHKPGRCIAALAAEGIFPLPIDFFITLFSPRPAVQIRGRPVSALISFYPFDHRLRPSSQTHPKACQAPQTVENSKIPITTGLIFSLQSGMLVSLNPVKLKQRSE